MSDDFSKACTSEQLAELESKAKIALATIGSGGIEERLPFVFEFSGSPKAGKTTIISIVAHFLRKMGFRLSTPPEAASLESPPDLKSDLLSFNVWCGCCSIQNVLQQSHSADPVDVLILDRGFFDWAVWNRFLATREKIISQDDCDVITRFALHQSWRQRVSTVFLFVSDFETSLRREVRDQLTQTHGRTMNQGFLADLHACYDEVQQSSAHGLDVLRLDTSDKPEKPPVNFQYVAYNVANHIIDRVLSRADQNILMSDRWSQPGFTPRGAQIDEHLRAVATSPNFMRRSLAEKANDKQQIVPYGFIVNEKGLILCARRKSGGETRELAGKQTFLFGGHAEDRDYDSRSPQQVFVNCLRRELAEEFIGINLQSAENVEFVGVINDVKSDRGKRHLAIVHHAKVTGRVAIRRQTADREFSRDAVSWKSKAEIAKDIQNFDPWSKIVAQSFLKIDEESSLFNNQ